MSAAYSGFYGFQWLVYLGRVLLNWLYGVLVFISKPGSRYIVPVCLAAAMFIMRAWLHDQLVPGVQAFIDGYNGTSRAIAWAQWQALRAYYGYTINPWYIDGIIAAIFLTAWLLYYLLSRLLSVVLGTFPQMTRPLRPLRRLEATSQVITPAVVTIAVPKLRF